MVRPVLHVAAGVVGSRSIDRGQGHAAQAQIDAQLAAVVNEVTEDQGSENGDPGHREDGAARLPQCPTDQEFDIGRAGDRGTSSTDVLVEAVERRRLRLGLRWGCRLDPRWAEVVRGLLHHRHTPQWELRQIQAEVAQRP